MKTFSVGLTVKFRLVLNGPLHPFQSSFIFTSVTLKTTLHLRVIELKPPLKYPHMYTGLNSLTWEMYIHFN